MGVLDITNYNPEQFRKGLPVFVFFTGGLEQRFMRFFADANNSWLLASAMQAIIKQLKKCLKHHDCNNNNKDNWIGYWSPGVHST